MRIAFAVIALLVIGCGTRYQPMGFSGGYSNRRMGGGRHFIEVSVNSFTSSGTALEYLHRRADELCPNGYRVLDADSSSSDHYVKIGNTLSNMPKSGKAALIQCRSAEPEVPLGDRDRGPPPQEAPPPRAGFYCTSSPVDRTVGYCSRTREKCLDRQATIVEDTGDASPCIEAQAAVCVAYVRVESGKRGSSCHPSVATCAKRRAEVTADDLAFSGVSECEDAW